MPVEANIERAGGMGELSRTDSIDTGSRDLGDGLEFNASGGLELNLRR